MMTQKKMTLEQLMKQIGCEKYPERWSDIFDEAMAAYENHECEVLKPEFYDEMNSQYGCFEKYGELYKKAAAQIAQDEPLARFLVLLCMALEDTDNKNADIKALGNPVAPTGKKPMGYEMVTGLAVCSQIKGAAERMTKRGLPADKIGEVISYAVNCGIDHYKPRHNGEAGYCLMGWAQLYIEGHLFMIKRLEMEFFAKFSTRAMVFRNAAGEIVTLAHDFPLHRDGYALGSLHFEDEEGAWTPQVEETDDFFVGHPFNEQGWVEKEKVSLSKSEWKKVLEKGDPVVSVHIPPTGKLTPELVDETLEETRTFLARYYSDFSYKAFFCHSWMMDPQLDEMLGTESNIVKFARRFTRLSYQSAGQAIFTFIFMKPDMNFDIKDLPENTTLERKAKQHYLDGKAIYECGGFFF